MSEWVGKWGPGAHAFGTVRHRKAIGAHIRAGTQLLANMGFKDTRRGGGRGGSNKTLGQKQAHTNWLIWKSLCYHVSTTTFHLI